MTISNTPYTQKRKCIEEMCDANMKRLASLEVFKQNWHWYEETDTWLKSMCIGYTLNVCCGQSNVGDVRLDIDERLRPDIYADCHALPFRPGSFDTVVLDPPFTYYRRIRWILDISLVARKRFILSTPNIMLSLKHFNTTLYATRFRNSLYVRQWVVYDRKNQLLSDTDSKNCNNSELGGIERDD